MSGQAAAVLDTSVLLAAAASPNGGSASTVLVLHHRRRHVATVVSAVIVREALTNLRRTFGPAAVQRFAEQMAVLQPRSLSMAHLQAALPLTSTAPVAAKDRHVLAACLASGAAICLTLDRRHLLLEPVLAWARQYHCLLQTPGEFLAQQRLS